jgi:hypothetical protein
LRDELRLRPMHLEGRPLQLAPRSTTEHDRFPQNSRKSDRGRSYALSKTTRVPSARAARAPQAPPRSEAT